MIHLHVTKEVFYKIKDGLKIKEFRPDNKYYQRLFKPILYSNNHFEPMKIYMGYPKKNDEKRIINASIHCCYWVNKDSSFVDPLFFKYYPNYNLPTIICVEFEILDIYENLQN